VETFRCPTCIGILPDVHARRCTECGQSMRRRRPRILGEETRIGAAYLPIDRWMLERLHGRHRRIPPVAWQGRFTTPTDRGEFVATAPSFTNTPPHSVATPSTTTGGVLDLYADHGRDAHDHDATDEHTFVAYAPPTVPPAQPAEIEDRPIDIFSRSQHTAPRRAPTALADFDYAPPAPVALPDPIAPPAPPRVDALSLDMYTNTYAPVAEPASDLAYAPQPEWAPEPQWAPEAEYAPPTEWAQPEAAWAPETEWAAPSAPLPSYEPVDRLFTPSLSFTPAAPIVPMAAVAPLDTDAFAPPTELDPEVRALVDELYQQARAELAGDDVELAPVEHPEPVAAIVDELVTAAMPTFVADAGAPTVDESRVTFDIAPPNAEPVAPPEAAPAPTEAPRPRGGWVKVTDPNTGKNVNG
jgi:hypothetical protein